MKALRAFGWGVAAVVGFVLFLSTCGMQAGNPTIRSSGHPDRDIIRAIEVCDAFDGFIGIWIEGPSSVRVNLRDGGHVVWPCSDFDFVPSNGGLGDISRGPSTATNGHSPNGYVGAEPKTVPPRR